jgi:hypothetical protein
MRRRDMRIEFQKAEVRALREAHHRAHLIAATASRLRNRADRVQQDALSELLADYAGWFPAGAELVYGPDRVPIGLDWKDAHESQAVPAAGAPPES